MRSPDRKISLGRLGKPHGIKGFLYIHFFGKDPRMLTKYEDLEHEDGTPMIIDELLIKKDRVIIKIKGINSRNNAEDFRDKEIFIPKKSLSKLEGNGFYHFQLKGLEVTNLEDLCLGKISNVMETGANDVLVVRPIEGSVDDKERLVPYIKDKIVKDVNLEEGFVLVDWPEDY